MNKIKVINRKGMSPKVFLDVTIVDLTIATKNKNNLNVAHIIVILLDWLMIQVSSNNYTLLYSTTANSAKSLFRMVTALLMCNACLQYY